MVRQDLHIHTRLSSCAKPTAAAADYIRQSKEMGLTTIAFTDHMWDSAVPGASGWYAPQNYEHILALKTELPAAEPGLRILFGCETECDRHGTLAISREVAAQLDVLLVPNSHTHMRDFVMPAALAEDPAKHGAFMVRHFMDIMNSPVAQFITAVPHPFAAVGCKQHEAVADTISDRDFAECFTAARENHIALEINTSTFGAMTPEHLAQCAYIRMYTIARELGCRFTIGSDSHDIPSQRTLPSAEGVMRAAGITENMLLSF